MKKLIFTNCNFIEKAVNHLVKNLNFYSYTYFVFRSSIKEGEKNSWKKRNEKVQKKKILTSHWRKLCVLLYIKVQIWWSEKQKNGLEKIKKTKKGNSRKACCLYCEQIKKWTRCVPTYLLFNDNCETKACYGAPLCEKQKIIVMLD